MAENRSNQDHPKRPAKRRRRKWHYYIPTVIMLVLALVCVGTIGWAIASVMRSQDPELNDSGENKITINTSPSEGPTESPTDPEDEVMTVAQLIAEADFIAAGYDYDTAISMLKESAYFGSNTELSQKVEEYTLLKSKLSVYASPSTITHVFFHSLIVDTDRAFDGDEDQDGYNMYMTTVEEFKAILQEMYDRGYVLISPYDMAYEVTDANGTHFTYGDIMLPSGKTPFLMSQDDLNYYSYMIGSGNGKNETPVFVDDANDGFASRIVIDEDGYPKCEYVDADGNVLVGDYDLVPVLETFIQEHPDFSYHGARAILGMTGYEGVFGYRTKPTYQPELDALHAADPDKYPSYEEEVAAAKEVAQCLRDHGWILASHSYGHPAYGNIDADRVETDSDKWEQTVETIIGQTDIILYPHGSDINSWREYTFENEKFAALYEDGYRYFFNVDGNTYWNQLGDNYFRGGRRNLDGYRMYHNPDKLSDLFDVEDVFDEARPLPVPTNGAGM